MSNVRSLPNLPAGAMADPAIEVAYLHHTAFGNLAATSEEAAVATSMGLAAMRAYRLVEHRLEEAALLGTMPAEMVSAILSATVETDRAGLTVNRLFSRIGYRDKSDGSDGGLVPLMDGATRLFGTCMDEGYYTISFSQDGESQMFADEVPFTELNEAMLEGAGPANLIVVHGTNTQGLGALIARGEWQPDLLGVPREPVVPAAQAKLSRRLAADILTKAQVCAIETDTRRAYVRELMSSLAIYTYGIDRWKGVDPDVARTVLEETMAALKKRMEKPSFGHKEAAEDGSRPPDLLPVAELARLIGLHQLAERAKNTTVQPDIQPNHRTRTWRGITRGHDALLVGAT